MKHLIEWSWSEDQIWTPYRDHAVRSSSIFNEFWKVWRILKNLYFPKYVDQNYHGYHWNSIFYILLETFHFMRKKKHTQQQSIIWWAKGLFPIPLLTTCKPPPLQNQPYLHDRWCAIYWNEWKINIPILSYGHNNQKKILSEKMKQIYVCSGGQLYNFQS